MKTVASLTCSGEILVLTTLVALGQGNADESKGSPKGSSRRHELTSILVYKWNKHN